MKRFQLHLALCVVLLLTGLIGTITAAEGESGQRSFSLVVREGFGSIKVGDLNTTLSSINSAYDSVREAYPKRCVGEILPLPNGFKDWEAELQWKAWKGLSVGIAVSGPTRYYQKSFLTYSIIEEGTTQTENDTWESEIHVSAPVKFNLYYSLPVISKVNLIINGGIGYYKARIEQTWQWQFRLPADTSSLGHTYFDVTGQRIGYHCGLALEYKFNERISMTVESQWRFAKIKSFKGSALTTDEQFDEYGNLLGSDSITEDGFLYHYIGDDLRINYSRHEKIILTSLVPPWLGADSPSDIRKAFLDLSGFTFRIGLKIGLF